ncbi:MAG: putative glycosyltransferase CsbB [candidate division WS6 bacterium OLB20]|uniref:Putative glycosyltransferase CsbB n=1 Tax=candidate division WS6 bacterium OLB20 TaxID=1617426 RepID=A0A136LZE3_9BACT|nr:MAG: putative glycosyltransferase CsbB [candidate division WS6 bacterium OLB20]
MTTLKRTARPDDFLLSVVAPVYNEEGNIRKFIERVVAAMDKAKIRFELILVNDGSKDDSVLIILQMAKEDRRIKLINFSRNFGHQMAISAGWDYANGDAVVILDSDLQDPPELIPDLVTKWQEGYDIVNAVRKTRQDTFFKKMTATLFYKLLNRILTSKIPENVGDFRLMDARPVAVMRKLKERDRYIRGLTNWIGFKQAFVEFDRDKRSAGVTNYTMGKMINLALNGVFSFSDFPRKLAHYAWILSLLLAVGIVVYAVVLHLTGINVPGWTSQVFIVVFFSSVQLFLTSIVLEYVSRVYWQLQNRPLYIVSETINLDPEVEEG